MNTNTNAEAEKIKKGAMALRMAAYLLAVMLVFSAVSFLCTVNAPVAPSPYYDHVDLTGFDFNNEIVTIQNTSFTMYPGAFYLPEDFAANKVVQTDVRYKTPGVPMGDFGTLRILLTLPPGEVYAIAGKSVSYAQRLFIDGKEYAPIGKTGESIEAVTPKSMRFIEGFLPTGDTTEIVIHYSAFVHADGGGLYPLDIGLLRNVVRVEQLKTFRDAVASTSLVTAALFFFGLFLFFPKDRYLLWFALACGCIALRDLFISDKAIMLLLPGLDWYLCIRLELILTCGMVFFSALYFSGLSPGASRKWAARGFAVFCTAYTFFVCLAPSTVFTRSTVFFNVACAIFCVCLLASAVHATVRKKTPYPLSNAEQRLLLLGPGIYAALSALGIYAHQRSINLWGLDFPQVGMMVFLFLNILALALGFARTDRALDEARRNERETAETNRLLARLNRIKSEFLGNISHEMKTPLTIMGGYAGVALKQIEMSSVNDKTVEILDIVQHEAQRLGRMVEQLKELAMENERQLILTDTDARTLLTRAADVCTSFYRDNKNKLVIHTSREPIPLRVDMDGIHQTLINLIGNASRHTHGGIITLSAEREPGNGAVILTVSDNGEGIDPEFMDRVFERGFSGDGSTGLGLAICKEIVEEHGGKIGLQSEKGKGTVVRFTLSAHATGEAEQV